MKLVHAYSEEAAKADAPREYVTLLKDDSDFEEAQLRKDLEADGYEVTVFYYDLNRVPGSPSDIALPFMTPLVAE
jgi:hypothetical protein